MNNNRTILITGSLFLLFLLCILATAWAQLLEVPEEARKYMARGQAAMALVKNPTDYNDAIAEFSKAVALAPQWADAHYNLGLAQKGAEQYENAIKSFKTYISLAPDAKDITAVQTEIYKLEYLQEKSQKQEVAEIPDINGTWEVRSPNNYNDVTVYALRINDGKIEYRRLQHKFIPPDTSWLSRTNSFSFDGKKFTQGVHGPKGDETRNWQLTVIDSNTLIEEYDGSDGTHWSLTWRRQ